MGGIRYAFRLLCRDPAYAAVAILTLALGIGATATLFSIAYGVLMKPLPWAESERIVRVTEPQRSTGSPEGHDFERQLSGLA